MEQVIAIWYLPPGIEQHSRKITFYVLPGTNLYPHMHFHGFEAKQKICMFNFSRRLISKTTAATPWCIDFAKILPEMCLIDKNEKSPSLEVPDRAVLEFWSIIWWSVPKSPPPIGYRVNIQIKTLSQTDHEFSNLPFGSSFLVWSIQCMSFAGCEVT